MRCAWLGSLLFLLTACPPEPVVATAPTAAAGLEGEPCAIGDRIVRRCGAGLACTLRPVVPPDPASRQTLSAENENCGGVGAIPCGEGLGCQLLTSEDVMAKDAMGTCQRESVCEPEAAAQ